MDHSLVYPFLTSEKLGEFLELRHDKSERELVQAFVRWVRKELRQQKG